MKVKPADVTHYNCMRIEPDEDVMHSNCMKIEPANVSHNNCIPDFFFNLRRPFNLIRK